MKSVTITFTPTVYNLKLLEVRINIEHLVNTLGLHFKKPENPEIEDWIRLDELNEEILKLLEQAKRVNP